MECLRSIPRGPSAESRYCLRTACRQKMSTYHATMKIMRTGKTMPHLAYITRTGKYRGKAEDLVFTKSENLPVWAKDARDYWEEADRQTEEKRQKAEKSGSKLPPDHTGRTWDFALPNELSREELIAFTDQYLKEEFPNLPYTYAIHEKDSAVYEEKNPHVHVMFGEYIIDDRSRNLTRDEFFQRHILSKKGNEYGGAQRTWEYAKGGSKKLRQTRRHLAEAINRAYREKGLPQRVTEKSIEVQRKEALREGNIQKAETLDRTKPKRLAPRKFKKYEHVISRKVRIGWEHADLSDVTDSDVRARICQEYEKQIHEEAMDRMTRQQLMTPTSREKREAVQEKLAEMNAYRLCLPAEKTEYSTSQELAEAELRDREMMFSISADDAPARPIQKEKYKTTLTRELEQLEMRLLREAPEKEKIREYAVRLYAEKEAEARLTSLREKGKTEPVPQEERDAAYGLRDLARAARLRAQRAGITREFIEAHQKEIADYLRQLQLLNTVEHDPAEKKTPRKKRLNARVLEMMQEYKAELFRWNDNLRKDETYRAKLEKQRETLEKCIKRKHVSPAVKKSLRDLLTKTEKTHDRILIRRGSLKNEDERLEALEKAAQRIEQTYITSFYELTPHTKDYYIRRRIEELTGREGKELKEKLRAQLSLKKYNEKQGADTAENDRKITELRRSLSELEALNDSREVMDRWAEAAARDSWKSWPENRKKLRRIEDAVKAYCRSPLIPSYERKRLTRLLEKYQPKTSRQKILDDAIKMKFAEFEKRVKETLPRSEKSYLMEIVRKESHGKMQAAEAELRWLNKEMRRTEKQEPDNFRKILNLEVRIEEAQAQKNELFEKYATPEARKEAGTRRREAQLHTAETVEMLRKEQLHLAEKELSRKHLSPEASKYCMEILMRTTKRIDHLDADLFRRLQRNRLRNRMNFRVQALDLKMQNRIADLAPDITDIPKVGTGRADFHVRHDQELER